MIVFFVGICVGTRVVRGHVMSLHGRRSLAPMAVMMGTGG